MRGGVAGRGHEGHVIAREQVETAFLGGSHIRFQRDKFGCRCHAARGGDENLVERARFHAVVVVCLDQHLIDFSVLDVIADIPAGEVCANGIDDRLRGDSFAFAGGRVNGQTVLGVVLRIGRGSEGDLRAGLQLLGELGRRIDKRLVVAGPRAVLQVKLHHGACAVAGDLRHLERGDGGLRQVHHRPAVNLFLYAGNAVERTFLPVFEPHHDGAVVGTRTAVHHRVAGGAAHQLNLIDSANVLL